MSTEDKAIEATGEAGQVQMVKAPVQDRTAVRVGQHTGLVLTDFDQVARAAKAISASGLHRKFGSAEAIFTVMTTGMELGFKPLQSLRHFDVIDGKLCITSDGLVALVQQRPDICKYFMVVEETPDSCVVETHRVGQPRPRRSTFTLQMAKDAGLIGKDVWKKYGARMLYHRASAWLVREVYPDLAAGLYTPDERMEVAEERRPQRAEVRIVADPVPITSSANELAADIEGDIKACVSQETVADARKWCEAADKRIEEHEDTLGSERVKKLRDLLARANKHLDGIEQAAKAEGVAQ